MRYLLFLCCWIVASSAHYSEPVRAVFGVRVAIQANSGLTTYVCFLDNGRTLSHRKIRLHRIGQMANDLQSAEKKLF